MKLEETILYSLLKYTDAATTMRMLKIISLDYERAVYSLKQNLWLQGMVGDLSLTPNMFFSLSDNYGAVLLDNKGKISFPYYIKQILSEDIYFWVLTVEGDLYYRSRTNNKQSYVKTAENISRIRSHTSNSIIALKDENNITEYDSYYIYKLENDNVITRRISTSKFIDLYTDDRKEVKLVLDGDKFRKVRTIYNKEAIITSLFSGKSILEYPLLSFEPANLESHERIMFTSNRSTIMASKDDYAVYENEQYLDNVSEYENNTYFGEGIDS